MLSDNDLKENLDQLIIQSDQYRRTMLSSADLAARCPLDNHLNFGLPAILSSGRLEALPVEILHMILVWLDLQSLTLLRSVSRSLRSHIDALYQYKNIVKYAPDSLRMALSTGIGSWISCQSLHYALCYQECECCGRFGSLLYMLTCSRVCYVCIQRSDRFLPLTPNHARIAYGLKRKTAKGLPTVLTLPGVYSLDEKTRRGRCRMVDRTMSSEAGIRLHGHSKQRMEAYVTDLPC